MVTAFDFGAIVPTVPSLFLDEIWKVIRLK